MSVQESPSDASLQVQSLDLLLQRARRTVSRLIFLRQPGEGPEVTPTSPIMYGGSIGEFLK